LHFNLYALPHLNTKTFFPANISYSRICAIGITVFKKSSPLAMPIKLISATLTSQGICIFQQTRVSRSYLLLLPSSPPSSPSPPPGACAEVPHRLLGGDWGAGGTAAGRK